MKPQTPLLAAFILFAFSCNKSRTTNTTPQIDNYQNTSVGSTWNFHQIDSSSNTPVITDFTLVSSSRDTTVNSRSYHVFTISSGGNQYLNLTGNDYYQFDSLPAGIGSGNFERLYLKDNAGAGASWTQSQTVTVTGVPAPVPVTLTYTIAEKNISRTVNNISYQNVIHVSSTISSSLIPATSLTSNINAYYAPKYGLIESSTKINLNYLGIVENVNLYLALTGSTLL